MASDTEEAQADDADGGKRLAVMGGVCIRVDDVSCLLEDGEWLGDKVIHFYLEYLRYHKFREHIEDVEVVSPPVVHCLRISKSREVAENMLAPLQLSRKKVVVLPVRGSAGQIASRGTHWSIIVLTPADGQFYHFDSLDRNRESAKAVANKVQHQLCCGSRSSNGARRSKPKFYHFRGIPRGSACDCGLYTLYNAEASIEHFLQGRDAGSFVPARKEDVRDMRKSILAIIRQVSEDQQEECSL